MKNFRASESIIQACLDYAERSRKSLSKTLLPLCGLCLGWPVCAQTEAAGSSTNNWTLQACLDYALAHNVQLKKLSASTESARIGVNEAHAAKLPTLSAGVSQALTYRPFQDTGSNFVNGGIATSAADKAMQSGSYGVNAQWVVWNGGQTRMNITKAEYDVQLAEYDALASANSIQEQIAQLYIQILYMQEAEAVNRTLLSQDSLICRRGEEMVEVGNLAKADLAQLSAQVSQGRYDLVNVQTQIAEAKMRLRQLLELPADVSFDIAGFAPAEAALLEDIPALESVYLAALGSRPEVKRSELAIEQSQLNTKIAQRGYYPTVSLTGSLGDSHVTGSGRTWFNQMKNNFNSQVGISVSIPILDNRKTKSAIERARVAETTAQLDLQDTQKELRQTVETYWLNAVNNQAKYRSAQTNVSALSESYELMNEQFNVGLKNIAELLNSRASLLQARQSMLQDKYTALLNRSLLTFYAGGELHF